MTRLMTTALIAALALPGAAVAKSNGTGHAKGNAHNAPGHASACPPGLAKKDPACVPPGLAKSDPRDDGPRDRVIRIGDRIDSDLIGTRYIILPEPARYGLDPRYAYYRHDGNLYRVDESTREVLALIGAVSSILN